MFGTHTHNFELFGMSQDEYDKGESLFERIERENQEKEFETYILGVLPIQKVSNLETAKEINNLCSSVIFEIIWDTKKDGTDLSPLSGLTNMAKLICKGIKHFKIKTLEPLQSNTRLIYLDCSSNKILTLKGIDKLEQLKYLNCSDNKLDKIDNMFYRCPHLESLDISGNEILSIPHISGCRKLKSLNISKTAITDISRLKYGQKMLEHIDASETNISDISWLSELPKLRTLILNRTQVIDVSSLYYAKDLTVYLYDTPFAQMHRKDKVEFTRRGLKLKYLEG